MTEKIIRYVGSNEAHNIHIECYHKDHDRLKQLSKSTLCALERYSSNRKNDIGEFHYLSINKAIEKFLSGESKLNFLSKGDDKYALLIHKAITRNSIRASSEFVYKGIKRDRDADMLKTQSVGSEFSFNQFVSTSYSDASALTHAEKDIMLVISSPVGIPVENNQEIEFLLPAQSQLKIIDIRDEIWNFGNDVRPLKVIYTRQIN